MARIEVKTESLNQPLVSVIIIDWNYAKYVAKTIESLKKQNYTNYEAIVVDNGSTDNSSEVIAEAIGSDDRFKIVENSKNLGQLGAFLAVFKLLKGDFVVSVDADDVLFANFISSHLQVHMALKDSIALTSSDVTIIDKDGEVIRHGYRGRNKHKPDATGLPKLNQVELASQIDSSAYQKLSDSVSIHHGPAGWIWGPGTSNMYRREVLDMISDPPKSFVWLRSSDNFINPLVHGLAGSALIDQELSAYRVHDKNYYGTIGVAARGRSSREVKMGQMKDFYETADWWLQRAGHFVPILKDKYWFVLGCLASYICIPSGKIMPGTKDTVELIKRNYAVLCDAFSKDVVNEHLPDYFMRGDIFSAIGYVDSIMQSVRSSQNRNVGATRNF